jgi:hypothetical protein
MTNDYPEMFTDMNGKVATELALSLLKVTAQQIFLTRKIGMSRAGLDCILMEDLDCIRKGKCD